MWLALLLTAHAHRPSFSDGGHATREQAFEVEEIDVSIVVYHELRCASPQLWLAVDALAGDALYFELGVPRIDRLADRRPSLALLGPGLPPVEPGADLPFALAEGEGARVFTTEEVDAGAEFFEPFTQTTSLVYAVDTLTLPRDGRYHLVARDPSGMTGKLWVATGLVEDFSGVGFDQLGEWLEQVRTFHEVEPYEPEVEPEERLCEAPDAPEDEAPAGCSGAPGGPGRLLGALALAILAFRASIR